MSKKTINPHDAPYQDEILKGFAALRHARNDADRAQIISRIDTMSSRLSTSNRNGK